MSYNNLKETMTVEQLIFELKRWPQSLLVYATWEGVNAPILEKNFIVKAGILEIDVEEY
jgi:hypothetical protein